MSKGIRSAFVFPLLFVWLLLPLGLMGIWLNDLCNVVLASVLGVYLLYRLRKKVRAEGAQAVYNVPNA